MLYSIELLGGYRMLAVFIPPMQVVKQAIVTLTVKASVTQAVSAFPGSHVLYEFF